MKINYLYTAHQFTETEMAPGYIYADEYIEPKIVIWFVQAPFSLDINGDFYTDMIIPMSRGYASGIDTRTSFLAFKNENGILSFSKELNDQMPVTAGARRAVPVTLKTNGVESYITVNHDTGDGNGADLIHISQIDSNGSIRPNLIPALPYSENKRVSFVDSHALASGDINGDGLTDILVGHWRNDGAYALIQKDNGTFEVEKNNFYKNITFNWPMLNKSAGYGANFLIDLHISDINNDGYGDIIAGWGGGSTSSQVFINREGIYSVDYSKALPNSIYGTDNQQHLKTFSYDFDRDGDQDLVILWSRLNPYYGGHYLQYLKNDGLGNFVDETTLVFSAPYKDAFLGRLQWSDYWQLLDVNNDSVMDIVGVRAASGSDTSQKNGLIYINDGYGNFTEFEFIAPTDFVSSIIQWGDLNKNGKLDFLTFESTYYNSNGIKSDNFFNVYEIDMAFPKLCISNDIEGIAGKAYRLYKAAFDRKPDLKGLGYWIHEMDNGAELTGVASGFISSAEFQSRYGTTSDTDFIRLLYENVLDRRPDPDGYAYWQQAMENGMSRESLLTYFSESTENKSNVAGLIANGIEYTSFIS